MPSHVEDLQFIPEIQNIFTRQIRSHLNHTIMLGKDFNRDISLLGKHHNNIFTNLQSADLE
jgi:hypothetical protein